VKDLKLRVSANGRYFVDQEGKPFFYLGDTCWLVFQRPNRVEVDEYLKDRAARDSRLFKPMCYADSARSTPTATRRYWVWRRSSTVTRCGPMRSSSRTWTMWSTGERAGPGDGLVPAKSWHVTDHPERVFDETSAYTFGKFLGARYKNNAVVWFPVVTRLRAGTRRSGWRWPRDQGRQRRQPACVLPRPGEHVVLPVVSPADWLDFNSIQSGHNFRSDSYAFVSKDYALKPAKPTVDMEPAYENHPTGVKQPRVDSHKVRSKPTRPCSPAPRGTGMAPWTCSISTRMPMSLPEERLPALAHGAGLRGLAPGGLMRRLFEQRPWHKMVPDQSVLASEQGEGTGRLIGAGARRELRDRLYAGRPAGQHSHEQAQRRAGERAVVRSARWNVETCRQYSTQGTRNLLRHPRRAGRLGAGARCRTVTTSVGF